MSTPSTLTITLTDATTVTISVPPALQALDSGQQANEQAGKNALDILLNGIFQRGYFYNSARTQAFASSAIKSVSWS